MTHDQDRPLSIAVFSDSALPILNGVSVSIDGLVSELRSRGHSVHVFTSAHFKFRDPDPNTLRFFALQTPWTKGYPLAVPPFYPMLYHFRKQKFDLVHTHTPWTVGFVGLRWAESHGLPIVSTYHTLYDKYAHYIPFAPRRYVRYRIAKHTNFYYNSVRHVITPSEFSKRWLLRHSVHSPITVIPTGVRNVVRMNRAEARAALGVGPNERVMIYVGRIAHEKNMGTLFEAAAQAMRADPRLRFWLVGDGPMRAECAEMARSFGIGDRVRFWGYVDRASVDRYYAASDLFVFSSMTETQGLVVIEAMQHGLPAVVVQGGGASAAVENGLNGFIVRNDSAQFSDCVLDVLGDEDVYDRLSIEAECSVRERTIHHMVDQVLGVYRSVLTPVASPVEVSR